MKMSEDTRKLGYGSRVNTPDGPGMVVGRTTRGYRVLVLVGSAGNTNRGRHFGEGVTRTYRPGDVEVESA